MVPQREVAQDRLSQLPDELIHHIFSYLDSRDAVHASVLSKRWVNFWTTLDYLTFKAPYFSNSTNLWFVHNFLNHLNQKSVIRKFKVDCNWDSWITNYVLSHNVEHSHTSNGNGSPCKMSKLIALKLTLLRKLNPVTWNSHSLTSLHLSNVMLRHQILRFDKLKELTLAGSVSIRHGPEVFNINCPVLQSLNLLLYSSNSTFVFSTPKLSYFQFRCGGDVPGFFAGDGFCCIKQVDIDINIEVLKYDKGKELTRQNITNMFEAVRRTPLLILSWNVIKILCGIPLFTYYQRSPFRNIKFLYLRGQPMNEEATRSTTNHVIHYLLSETPCAEILLFK